METKKTRNTLAASKQFIKTSGPVVFPAGNVEIEINLSYGDIRINQLPVPDFIGQKVHIYGVGPYRGRITGGTGLYINDVVFTSNTGGVYLTGASSTEWRVGNGKTAEYISGITLVKQYSDGDMKTSFIKTGNSGTGPANVFGSSSGAIGKRTDALGSHEIPFAAIPIPTLVMLDLNMRSINITDISETHEGLVELYTESSGNPYTYIVKYEGKY